MLYKKFVDYFKDYHECFCIIGGNAASILLNDELYNDTDFQFRQTRDYDMVIIAEMKNRGFSQRLFQFLNENGYGKGGYGTDNDQNKSYYRFVTSHKDVPPLIETFSREPMEWPLLKNNHKTPVSEGYDPSLSAILLNNDYYELLKRGVVEKDNLPILDVPYLIFFKIQAHLDILKKIEEGERISHRADKSKHFKDVCQLSMLLTSNNRYDLLMVPERIKGKLQEFIDMIDNMNDRDFSQRFKEIKPAEVRPDRKQTIKALSLLL